MKILKGLTILLFWILSPILFLIYWKGLNIFKINECILYVKYGKIQQPYVDVYLTLKNKFQP